MVASKAETRRLKRIYVFFAAMLATIALSLLRYDVHSMDKQQSTVQKTKSMYIDFQKDPDNFVATTKAVSKDTTSVSKENVKVATRESGQQAAWKSNPEPILGANFTQKWCNLEGTKWYPTDEFQKRTPYFLLAGAKKSGTTSLSLYLAHHPQLTLPRAKELLMFLPNKFGPFLDSNNKTLVKKTRHYMYEHDYKTIALKSNPSLLGYEATPGYLFQSTTCPTYILCTCPWVKILLILRDPIDRAWSNYNFYVTQGIPLNSFEAWITGDLNLLKRTGVLNASDEIEEYYAWNRYLELAGEGPIGRSMYAIQLQHWYNVLRAIGRDPVKDIFIVRNEDLKRNATATLNRIYAWLGVPPLNRTIDVGKKEFMVSRYEEQNMKESTRTRLQAFFGPYNQRLYDLLGAEWQGIWDGDKKRPQRQDDDQKVEKQYVKPNANRLNMKRKDLSNSTSIVPSIYSTPTYNASVAARFVKKWCGMTNVTDWYPTGNDAWQLRAPYFLLPGAKKSGTTSLASYLMEHPKVEVARTKELQFFLNKNFRARFVRDSDRKTFVHQARMAYGQDFHKSRLQRDGSLISMDATPGYLFFSSVLPQRILCVCPWVKLVVLLRNPVDRAYSNYAYVVRRTGMKAPFEKWIAQDFKALRTAGVISQNNEYLTVQKEDEAWARYLGLAMEGPIGRSIYIIQLRHWFQAMRDIGRSPESQIHIVRSEDLKRDVQGEYRKVLDFLGLEHHPLATTTERVVSQYASPMSNETRARLEKFFAPYNDRLYDMLGGDWKGYWDPERVATQ